VRTVCLPPIHNVIAPIVVAAALFAAPPIASAQGFGIGARMAWVTNNSDVEVDSVRFVGGHIRLVSRRWGLEVSMDRHSESFESLNQKVTETPIQTSLLLRMGSPSVSPFLLGGGGWYRRKVEVLDGPDAAVQTTDFGWHAGLGLEIVAGRHFGFHGDYRYTFLDFGKDNGLTLIGGLLPGHRGSQWTLGATIYF